MAETYYVIKEISISRTGAVNLREAYRLMKEWASQRKYHFIEKEYKDSEAADGKSVLIRWDLKKKVDDYTRVIIDVVIRGDNLKEVTIKKKKLVHGDVSVYLESYVEKDYEENWEKNPVSKFIREVFDKIVVSQHFDKVHKDLRSETYALYDEIKRYLKVLQ